MCSLLEGFKAPHETRVLDGDFRYKVLVTFNSMDALEAIKRHLRNVTSQPPNAPDAPYLVLADPVEQHLMLTGTTFFIGMDFAELRRLQLDIETYISPGFEFPSAAREGDRVIAISLTDSTGFERLLKGTEMDERAMLEEMVRIIQERDPDVVEGHNLFRFDLEYLETRARRHRVPLKLGRDGGEFRARPSRMQIAERSIAYRRYDIPGRNIIDTWILAQHYDISSRELESLGLKQLAQHFGLARKDRVYIDASKISHYFEHEPDKLYEYALDDARETRALAETLSPSYFVQAQIFPYSYQSAVLRGNATKIDALMMRAYLAAGHSIPAAVATRAGRRRLHRDSPMRRRARCPALRRHVAVSVADAAISACAGGRSSRRIPQAARRPAQLPRAGQSARARTGGERTPQRRRTSTDVQNSDQFVLWLPGIFARAFQRLRRGERFDQARTRPDSARSRGTRGARRTGYRS